MLNAREQLRSRTRVQTIIFFREVKRFFKDSEKSRPFSYTCANFCFLDSAIVDLSSGAPLTYFMLVAKNVIRLS